MGRVGFSGGVLTVNHVLVRAPSKYRSDIEFEAEEIESINVAKEERASQ